MEALKRGQTISMQAVFEGKEFLRGFAELELRALKPLPATSDAGLALLVLQSSETSMEPWGVRKRGESKAT